MPTVVELPMSVKGEKLVKIVQASMQELPNFLFYRSESGSLITLDARPDINFDYLAGSLPNLGQVMARRELLRIDKQHFKVDGIDITIPDYTVLVISVGRLDKKIMSSYNPIETHRSNPDLCYLVSGILKRFAK
ncbi:hypothetical protein HY212_03270 [Candidatus Pacearchaeota archaeon]|nr:hypothetical protein [Candidatus Pacearchaeota archaeon]